MLATPDNKQNLRTQLLATRRGLGPSLRANVDAALARRVLELPQWEVAPIVLAYLSVHEEVDTRALVAAALTAGKVVAAPRVVGPRSLAWYAIGEGETFERSRMGIDEPYARPERLVDVASLGEDALALVPGLAFDAQGYRLGYGGGFYDAFLHDFAGVSVGLCRSATLVESLAVLGATEPHDLPVDLVVTEAGAPPCPRASGGAGISPA